MPIRPLSRSLIVAAAAFAVAGLAGCASTPAMKAIQHQQDQMQQAARDPSPVTIDNGNYVSDQAVDYVNPADAVSLTVSNVPLSQALRQILPPHTALSFEKGVNPHQLVSVDVSGMNRAAAMRQVALAAGAVVVNHPRRRQVIVAERATYLYRVPAGLFQGADATLNVSSTTSLRSGSTGGMSGSTMSGSAGSMASSGGTPAPGSTPSGGSSMGSGQGNGAMFSVSGSTPHSKFLKNLKALVAPDGRVSVDPMLGEVSVTAGAGGLRRADRYIRNYVAAATTEVEIHAAILEVQLSESMSSGINWSKVLNSNLAFGLNAAVPATASVVSSASSSSTSFSITKTGASLNGVIKALQNVAKVRVVTEPWLATSNGMPATLNSGTEVPYVGDIMNNVSGLSGTTTTGSSVSYANDGVALSFIPQVLNRRLVQMTIVPSLSNIQSFKSFSVNGETLTGPVLQQRDAYVRLLARPGKTVILGGSITRSANTQSSGIPWASRIPFLGALFGGVGESHARTQLVILVRTRIVHGHDRNPLVGESL